MGQGVRDLASGETLAIGDIYSAVKVCEAPDCGMLFYG